MDESEDRRISDDSSCGGGCCGGCLGSILLTLVAYVGHLLFVPGVLGDGQYGMIIFFTGPFGFALGGLTGFALMLQERRTKTAGWMVLIGGSVIGGTIMLQALSEFSARLSGSDSQTPVGAALGFMLPLIGVPILWAFLLVAWGIKLKAKNKNE